MRIPGIFVRCSFDKSTLDEECENNLRVLAENCPKLVAYEDYMDSVIISRKGKRISMKLVSTVEPQELLKDGLVWPSGNFVRATARRFGGPSQPAPMIYATYYN